MKIFRNAFVGTASSRLTNKYGVFVGTRPWAVRCLINLLKSIIGASHNKHGVGAQYIAPEIHKIYIRLDCETDQLLRRFCGVGSIYANE